MCKSSDSCLHENGFLAPPPALVNVVVRPSTILALLLWDVGGDGGYPIINFTAQYRLAYTNDSWIPISPNHITPNSVSFCGQVSLIITDLLCVWDILCH